MEKTPLTASERCVLANEVFDVAFDAFENFGEQNVGRDLAYLIGAITDLKHPNDSFVDWTTEAYGENPPSALLNVLKSRFNKKSPLWRFIRLEGGEK